MVVVSEWIGIVLATIFGTLADIAQCNIGDNLYRHFV